MVKRILYNEEAIVNEKVDFKQARMKGIKDESLYFLLQSLYKKGFEYFLNMNFSLDAVDQKIKNSSYLFGVVPKERREFYHKISYLDLNYIFVRNFLYIERLDVTSIDFLKKRVEDNKWEVDVLLLRLVEETYSLVFPSLTQAEVINYGRLESPIHHFSKDALAIYIVYGKNPLSLSDEDFLKNRKEKETFLGAIEAELKQRGKELGLKVEVTSYKMF